MPSSAPILGSFAGAAADFQLPCEAGTSEVVYTFTLQEPADVTVDLSVEGVGSVALLDGCTTMPASELMRCIGGAAPRFRQRGLPAGTYYLVVEGTPGDDYQLTVDVASPPANPVGVVANDSCVSAHVLPENGGVFVGDTSSHSNGLGTSSSCGAGAAGPDVAFELNLSAQRRIVASTFASSYEAVLHIHGLACSSGQEIACSAGGEVDGNGRLDLVLDPGTYYFVVDGAGPSDVGPYVLDLDVI